jgi:hypothetical protein
MPESKKSQQPKLFDQVRQILRLQAGGELVFNSPSPSPSPVEGEGKIVILKIDLSQGILFWNIGRLEYAQSC